MTIEKMVAKITTYVANYVSDFDCAEVRKIRTFSNAFYKVEAEFSDCEQYVNITIYDDEDRALISYDISDFTQEIDQPCFVSINDDEILC